MLPALRVGGVYRARVESLLVGGRVRIDLKGETLCARCEAAVREGEIIDIEVLRIRPEVVLKIRRRSA